MKNDTVQMKTYTVQHAGILHNGTLYPEGAMIELTDDDARHLGRYVQPCFSEFTPNEPLEPRAPNEPPGSPASNEPPESTDKTTKKGRL